MRFTEHELTAAVTGAARSVVAARRRSRRGSAGLDAAWETMDRYERYQLLDAVGAQILPVLTALPDVEVAPGARASYTNQQVSEVVAGLVGQDLGRVRRAVLVKARTALVQTALASVPPRLGPDGPHAPGATQDP